MKNHTAQTLHFDQIGQSVKSEIEIVNKIKRQSLNLQMNLKLNLKISRHNVKIKIFTEVKDLKNRNMQLQHDISEIKLNFVSLMNKYGGNFIQRNKKSIFTSVFRIPFLDIICVTIIKIYQIW